MLNRQIDQIGGIAHGVRRLLDRCFDHDLTAFSIGLDVQVGADELVIAVEGAFRFGVPVHQR